VNKPEAKKLFLSFSLILGLAGCAATQWPPLSGFLNDYRGMYRSNEVKGLFVYEHPRKGVVQYNKFMVDPVTVIVDPQAGSESADPEAIKLLARQFHDDIINSLKGHYAIVNQPGEGVLRIRAAVSQVQMHRFSWMQSAVIEAELVDTKTNERILALLQERKGKAFKEWPQMFREQLDSYHQHPPQIYESGG
jgi:hypothetical protein